ncbi:DhNV_025 [Dikerogammarus haemobaphes nudivirus]|nr:DhNV_025 [Dikerogammarus haemobaphes nudivirus]
MKVSIITMLCVFTAIVVARPVVNNTTESVVTESVLLNNNITTTVNNTTTTTVDNTITVAKSSYVRLNTSSIVVFSSLKNKTKTKKLRMKSTPIIYSEYNARFCNALTPAYSLPIVFCPDTAFLEMIKETLYTDIKNMEDIAFSSYKQLCGAVNKEVMASMDTFKIVISTIVGAFVIVYTVVLIKLYRNLKLAEKKIAALNSTALLS